MLSIATSAGDAPAARAIDSLNLACFSRLNSALEMGRDSESLTTCVATEVAGGEEGASSVAGIVTVPVSPCPGGEGDEAGAEGVGTQGPPLGPVKPMPQVQSCCVELAEPAAVCELSGQDVHPVLPGSALYLPCSHARHEPLSGE